MLGPYASNDAIGIDDADGGDTHSRGSAVRTKGKGDGRMDRRNIARGKGKRNDEGGKRTRDGKVEAGSKANGNT